MGPSRTDTVTRPPLGAPGDPSQTHQWGTLESNLKKKAEVPHTVQNKLFRSEQSNKYLGEAYKSKLQKRLKPPEKEGIHVEGEEEEDWGAGCRLGSGTGPPGRGWKVQLVVTPDPACPCPRLPSAAVPKR